MNRGFGINFLDEVSESMKTSGRCSTLHISCTKCLPVFCWFNPHQDIQPKKQSPSKLWLAQIPHGLSGAKKQIPVFVWSKMSKITAFSAGWQTSRACARHEPRPKPLGIRPHLPGNININHWSLGQKFWTRLRSLHRNTVSR